jgi:hypothetical protein
MDEQHSTQQAPSAPCAPSAPPAPNTVATTGPTLRGWAVGVATPFAVLLALAVPALVQAVLH